MSETTQLIRYRDLVLRMQKSVMKKIKRKEENIKEIDALTWQKSKKNTQVEHRKAWYNRQSKEKQVEMREKAKSYSKNRYHNHIIVVS